MLLLQPLGYTLGCLTLVHHLGISLWACRLGHRHTSSTDPSLIHLSGLEVSPCLFLLQLKSHPSIQWLLFFSFLKMFGCAGSLLLQVGILLLRGYSPVVASWGYSLLWWCSVFSPQWLLLLSMGSRACKLVGHGLCCPVACGIFLDQGLNPCPLHWQADS